MKSLIHALLHALSVFLLLILFTVFLQHLRRGSSETALMGQRTKIVSIEQQNVKSYLEKTADFFHRLKEFHHWKTLRGSSVIEQVVSALKITLLLVIVSFLISIFWAGLLIFLAHHYTFLRNFITQLVSAINTTPIFILGIFLIYVFSFLLNLLPAGGDDALIAYILPSMALALKSGGRFFILISEHLQALEQANFIINARARGLSHNRVLLHQLAACRNSTLSFWFIELAGLFSGAVIIETLFSVHGLGNLLIFSLMQYDLLLLFTTLLVVSIFVLFSNLLQAQLKPVE